MVVTDDKTTVAVHRTVTFEQGTTPVIPIGVSGAWRMVPWYITFLYVQNSGVWSYTVEVGGYQLDAADRDRGMARIPLPNPPEWVRDLAANVPNMALTPADAVPGSYCAQ